MQNDDNKKIESFIKRCEGGSVILTNFLDENEQSNLLSLLKHNNINYYCSGGISNSERNRYLLSLYDIDIDFKINVYKIIYNKKYYEFNHRNVLGSILSIGIKRECVGDIVIDDNKDIYIAVTKEISPFIETEFKMISNASISLELIDYEVKKEDKYEIKNVFLSSLRLDAVISASFNISRNDAKEFILGGLAFLNHINTLNVSQMVKEDDLISLRHKGRIKIFNVIGKSKSDRLIVKVGKLL